MKSSPVASFLTDFFDLFGFVLLVVTGSAAFISFVAWRSRGSKHPVVLGLSLFLFFLTWRVMLTQFLALMPHSIAEYRDAWANTLSAVAILSLAYMINLALKRYVWHGALKHSDTQSAVPDILVQLANFGVYATAVLLISGLVFQRDVTAVAATSGAVAFIIGYSAQSTLAEIFSGLALNLTHPFRKGDSVQVDGIWAIVVDSGWRAVTLRTYDGNLIILPNSKAANLRLTNLSQPNTNVRQHIPITVDIGVAPERVREVAMQAMLGLPYVLRDPKPMVLAKGFNELGMMFEVIFWQPSPHLWILRQDEVVGAVWYAFDRAGIPLSVRRRETATPHDASPAVQPVSAEAISGEAQAALNRSSLLAALPLERRAELAQKPRRLLFGPLECIVRQGDPGSSLFVILRGKVEVSVAADGGSEAKIAQLGPGDSFGEMSLMTGEPRSATVRAAGDVAVIEIEKSALEPMLRDHPELVEALAAQVIALGNANKEHLSKQQKDGTAAAAGSALSRLAGRIRGFFGI